MDKAEKKKNGKTVLIVSLVTAAVICGAVLYMYYNAKSEQENEEYMYAMHSNDRAILRNYLDLFDDAPQAHRDSVMARLSRINDMEREWSDAVMSASRDDIYNYITRYPGTRHKREALRLIDSLDFIRSCKLGTEEAYNKYLNDHNDGDYYEYAQDSLKRLRVKIVTAEERSMIDNAFYNFFTSISTRDEERLLSAVVEPMTLLNKTDATGGDLVELMNKMYKENVVSISWQPHGDMHVRKREIGDYKYEYYISFTTTCTKRLTDNKDEASVMRINAAVNPDGLISELRMTRLTE